MAREKKWDALSAIVCTADGTVDGVLTIENTVPLHVKQLVGLKSDSQPGITLQVKRVLSLNKIQVGLQGQPIDRFTDVSAYTTADNAFIIAGDQNRPAISPDDTERSTFEEEPVVARRVYPVDELGRAQSYAFAQVTAFLNKLTAFDDVVKKVEDGLIHYYVYLGTDWVLRLRETVTPAGYVLEKYFPSMLQEDGSFLLQENGDPLSLETF